MTLQATAPGAQAWAQMVPAPPPGALPYERGPHDTAVLGCVSAMTDALRPTYGSLAFERWILPGGATWPEVAAHYQAQLRPGWTVDRLPERLAGCRMRSWTGSPGLRRVAMALVDDVFAATDPFKVVVVAKPAEGRP